MLFAHFSMYMWSYIIDNREYLPLYLLTNPIYFSIYAYEPT